MEVKAIETIGKERRLKFNFLDELILLEAYRLEINTAASLILIGCPLWRIGNQLYRRWVSHVAQATRAICRSMKTGVLFTGKTSFTHMAVGERRMIGERLQNIFSRPLPRVFVIYKGKYFRWIFLKFHHINVTVGRVVRLSEGYRTLQSSCPTRIHHPCFWIPHHHCVEYYSCRHRAETYIKSLQLKFQRFCFA